MNGNLNKPLQSFTIKSYHVLRKAIIISFNSLLPCKQDSMIRNMCELIFSSIAFSTYSVFHYFYSLQTPKKFLRLRLNWNKMMKLGKVWKDTWQSMKIQQQAKKLRKGTNGTTNAVFSCLLWDLQVWLLVKIFIWSLNIFLLILIRKKWPYTFQDW